jgi:hypothetical protein
MGAAPLGIIFSGGWGAMTVRFWNARTTLLFMGRLDSVDGWHRRWLRDESSAIEIAK